MTLKTGDLLQQKRYRIVKRLGEGGMGAVYRAWDTRLNIPVALKEMIPQPDLDTDQLDQLRQQFQQEATILARLHHPNLVRVTDFFEEQGRVYLVMDYVEGEGLDKCIQREDVLSEKQVLSWAEELLDALAYCHSEGILHRDVKPQNVIIRPDRHAVLVDFGLVKLWDPNDPRTKTAMRGMGTPEYAPPEQYEVDAGHTDPRTDIYSLGATLYHALTGQAPPTATLRIADPEQFIPPRSLKVKISRKTEQAILKSLELPRTQRWQTIREMAQALEVAVPQWEPADELKVEKPSTGAMARGGTRKMIGGFKGGQQQSRPWAVWMLVGMLSVLLTGGGWWLWQNNQKGALFVPQVTATKAPNQQLNMVTAVASPTSKPTTTSTSTPSSTPTNPPTATPMPTNTPTPLPIPEILSPNDNSGYYTTSFVPMRWDWEETLNEDQRFVVMMENADEEVALRESVEESEFSFTAVSQDLEVGTYIWWIEIEQRVDTLYDWEVVAQSESRTLRIVLRPPDTPVPTEPVTEAPTEAPTSQPGNPPAPNPTDPPAPNPTDPPAPNPTDPPAPNPTDPPAPNPTDPPPPPPP